MDVRCLQCKRSMEIIPGHRPRRYCSNECRQTAYRRRHGVLAKPFKESQAMKSARAIREMEKKWPGLGFSTYWLLEEIQRKHGEKLAMRVANKIVWEMDQAKKQL